jgi:hypothetical protein
MTATEERLIIIFRKLVAEASDERKPSENIAGMVLTPKMNITSAP